MLNNLFQEYNQKHQFTGKLIPHYNHHAHIMSLRIMTENPYGQKQIIAEALPPRSGQEGPIIVERPALFKTAEYQSLKTLLKKHDSDIFKPVYKK